VQEGARRFRISGGAAAVTLGTFEPLDISRETNGDVMLLVTLKMTDAPDRAGIAMRSGAETAAIATCEIPQGSEFVRYGLSLKCLRDKGVDMTKVAMPFVFATEGATDYRASRRAARHRRASRAAVQVAAWR
jgi:beta-glucosidase